MLYALKYIYEDDIKCGLDAVFSSFAALREAITEPEEDVTLIECMKLQIDRSSPRQIAYLTPSFALLRFDPTCCEGNKERDIYCGVFDGLWFDFPTPFRKTNY